MCLTVATKVFKKKINKFSASHFEYNASQSNYISNHTQFIWLIPVHSVLYYNCIHMPILKKQHSQKTNRLLQIFTVIQSPVTDLPLASVDITFVIGYIMRVTSYWWYPAVSRSLQCWADTSGRDMWLFSTHFNLTTCDLFLFTSNVGVRLLCAVTEILMLEDFPIIFIFSFIKYFTIT